MGTEANTGPSADDSMGRFEYYKQMVDNLVECGGLEVQRQRPISQSTLDFLISRKKDPISLLNIYCSASGDDKFEFYNFRLKYQGSNGFICVTELDGHPIYGICAPSKQEAKKACALRLIDSLMSAQRLDCISANGRKLKRLPPRPLPTAPTGDFEQSEQQNESNITFSDDIDFDGIKLEFEQLNPVADDCENADEFKQLRDIAYGLHCKNAFWCQIGLSELTLAKMAAACRSTNNPIAFVNHCLLLANASAQNEQIVIGEMGEGQPPQKQTLNFVVFNLPYIPAHYACLTRFDGQIYHGSIAASKQKAKTSCAAALCEVFAQKGMSDIKAKKRRSKSAGKTPAKKQKVESAEGESSKLGPHQYLLTLHPNESLDPSTHFILASSRKCPVQVLNEIVMRENFPLIAYTETTDESTGKFIARVDTIDGAEWSCPEETKKAAKCSAARKAIDKLVKEGKVPIAQEDFGKFRAAFVKFCNTMGFGGTGP